MQVKASTNEGVKPQTAALHSNLLKEIEGASIQRTLRHVNPEANKSSGSPVARSVPSSVSKVTSPSPSLIKPSMMKAASTSTNPSTMKPSTVKPSTMQPSSFKSSTVQSNPFKSTSSQSVSFKSNTVKSQQPVMEERIITPSHTSTIRCGIRGGGWEERFTVDDVPYYYNKSTDCLSWEKPECLRTEEEKKEGSTKWTWLEDEEEAWIPVCVVSERDLSKRLGFGEGKSGNRPK